jgi:hypothetical protein
MSVCPYVRMSVRPAHPKWASNGNHRTDLADFWYRTGNRGQKVPARFLGKVQRDPGVAAPIRYNAVMVPEPWEYFLGVLVAPPKLFVIDTGIFFIKSSVASVVPKS